MNRTQIRKEIVHSLVDNGFSRVEARKYLKNRFREEKYLRITKLARNGGIKRIPIPKGR